MCALAFTGPFSSSRSAFLIVTDAVPSWVVILRNLLRDSIGYLPESTVFTTPVTLLSVMVDSSRVVLKAGFSVLGSLILTVICCSYKTSVFKAS